MRKFLIIGLIPCLLGNGPCPEGESLEVLTTESFGPLREAFQCRVFIRQPLSQRRAPISSPAGRVTAHWAQEMVGSDLATEYLDQLDRRHGGITREVPLGIYDGGMAMTQIRRDRTIGTARACRDAVSTCNPDIGDLLGQGMSWDEASDLLPEQERWCPAMQGVCPETINTHRVRDPFGSSVARVPNREGMSHGTQVANIIIGPQPIGGGSRARLSWVHPNGIPVGKNPGSFLRSFASASPRPEVVNVSMGCVDISANSESCRTYTNELTTVATRSIMVKSAGNEAPLPAVHPGFPGIVVGSLSPSGLLSDYSSEGPEVTISAPSDWALLSRGMRDSDNERTGGMETHFNGTSGAAPVVTSAISNALSLLPGLTTEEAKTLLRRTAINTAGFRPDNGRNGAGALNSFKLTRVAARLHARGWPASRIQLSEDSLYDFSSDVQGMLRTYREQTAGLPYNERICDRHRQALRALRVAFFLNPENVAIREALAAVYRANGYEAQAAYVDPETTPREAARTIPNRDIQLKALLHNRAFHDHDIPVLANYMNSMEMEKLKAEVAGHLFDLPPRRAVELTRRLMPLLNADSTTILMDGLRRQSSANPFQFFSMLRQVLTESPHTVSRRVVFNMAKYYAHSTHMRDLIALGLQSDEPQVRRQAAAEADDLLTEADCRQVLGAHNLPRESCSN